MGIAEDMAAMQMGINPMQRDPSRYKPGMSQSSDIWVPTSLPSGLDSPFAQFFGQSPYFNQFQQGGGNPFGSFNPFGQGFNQGPLGSQGNWMNNPWMQQFMQNMGDNQQL